MSCTRLCVATSSAVFFVMISACASNDDGEAASSTSSTSSITATASLTTAETSSSGSAQPPTTTSTETADASTSDAPLDTSSDSSSEGPPPPVDCTSAELPAWLDGKPTHEWFEIPDTSGAGGAAINAYSGFAFRDSTSEIVIAAAGGHSDSADNRVVTLALVDDAPTWVLRHASSTDTPIDVPYYPDGLPSARHIYQSAHVVDSQDRVFLVYARFVYGSAVSFPTVDAFDLSTNLWDPQGTWADVPEGGSTGALTLRPTEEVLTSTLFTFRASDATWAQPIGTKVDVPVRWPLAHDTMRDRVLTLQWGDGQGYDGPDVHSTQVDMAAGVQSIVTLEPSDALTTFETEMPTYSAMDYDPDNDRFLFYSGQGEAAGRVYVVEASDEDMRSIALLELGAGSITPPPSPGSGVNNRFRYVPGLCGFVLAADAASNLQFLRTAG